jgi:anti-anti-sigma regulatory factor
VRSEHGPAMDPHRATTAVSPSIPAPRRELRSVGADTDDHLDVRLHAPTPLTVVVRVAGPLHARTTALLTMRVRQQFRRAPHVVLDLSAVTHIDPSAAGELRALHGTADSCGSRLHVAADDEAVVEELRRIDPIRHVVLGSADAVVAELTLRRS